MVDASSGTTLRQQLSDTSAEAVRISGQLLCIIARKTINAGGKRTGKLDHSQPPWNTPAAHVYLELHALARCLEDEFRRIASFPVRKRGGSDANTRLALQAMCKLAESVQDGSVLDALRSLEKWSTRARVTLGELERPSRLPRLPGAGEPRCPWCKRMTLRSWALAGQVRCINPECKDDAERRPSATMEWSIYCEDWVLAWHDGTVGLEVFT